MKGVLIGPMGTAFRVEMKNLWELVSIKEENPKMAITIALRCTTS